MLCLCSKLKEGSELQVKEFVAKPNGKHTIRELQRFSLYFQCDAEEREKRRNELKQGKKRTPRVVKTDIIHFNWEMIKAWIYENDKNCNVMENERKLKT